MLDKNDLKAIGDLIDKKVMTVLGEFFENVLAPYLDAKFKKNDNQHDTIFRKLDEIDDDLLDHEKRIKKLETTLQS